MLLHLTYLRPPRREAALLRAFAALPAGRGLQVLSDHREDALLDALQRRHPGAFDCHVIEDEPARWVVVVAKRDHLGARPGQVHDFITTEHRRLSHLLTGMAAAVERERLAEVASAARRLEWVLLRHLVIEEETLLPLLTARLDSARVLAATLQNDHMVLLGLVTRLQRRCALSLAGVSDTPTIRAASDELRSTFERHAEMEERRLFPVADLLLSAEECDALVARCQTVPSVSRSRAGGGNCS
jgi:uncharacterized protein (DUF2249 family)